MQALPVQVAVGGDALPSGGRKINHRSVFILEGGVDRWQVARGRIQRPHIRGERELLDQNECTEGYRPGQGGDRIRRSRRRAETSASTASTVTEADTKRSG